MVCPSTRLFIYYYFFIDFFIRGQQISLRLFYIHTSTCLQDDRMTVFRDGALWPLVLVSRFRPVLSLSRKLFAWRTRAYALVAKSWATSTLHLIVTPTGPKGTANSSTIFVHFPKTDFGCNFKNNFQWFWICKIAYSRLGLLTNQTEDHSRRRIAFYCDFYTTF